MKRKKLVSILLVLTVMALCLPGCGTKQENPATAANESTTSAETSDTQADVEESTEKRVAEGDITIVYTNDVHSYIDNVVKDEEGNITGDGLRYSKVAAMVQDMRAAGENVLLVDAGDEIQGSVYGAMDEGAHIIDIMEATGYQLATPGNHEFDYGALAFFKLAETAEFPYVSCNFHPTKSKEIIFSDTKVFDIAGQKVAFVGITTPETITSSTPVYFQDETGEFIYTVDGMNNPNDLYISVQNAIDKVRDEADYVIALGHLGVGRDAKRLGVSSEDVIANVTGLDAFIDGHSHTTIEGDKISDKDGNSVLLTQTGNYLSAVGVMTITTDGKLSTKLVNDYDREDETVAKLENDWIQEVNDKMSEKIGELDSTLYILNPDNSSQRLIRAQELNAGDFIADSVYWFFNERLDINCDIAIMNGGGIRNQIEKGDLTYLSAKQVQPFGNMICLISATGQQIIDALELGTTEIGEWNDEWDSPAENGGFLHVAGLSYTIDSSVPSSVKTDENGMFVSVEGDYRVKDVKVYNKEKGEYEPINPDGVYQLGGINYLLRNGGNGINVFDEDELVVDYVGQDYVILAEYILSFEKEGEFAKVNTKNSPLSKYKGYLIDYENPYGADRISIILEN